MARNAPDPSQRGTPSRVTKSPVQKTGAARAARPPRKRRDRRTFWIQLTAAFLVLVMLLPVIAFLF